MTAVITIIITYYDYDYYYYYYYYYYFIVAGTVSTDTKYTHLSDVCNLNTCVAVVSERTCTDIPIRGRSLGRVFRPISTSVRETRFILSGVHPIKSRAGASS